MKLNTDSISITIPCPKCGKKMDEKIGRLKKDPDITCACGQVITIKAQKLRSGIEAAQKSLDSFGKSLGKIR